MYLDIHRHSSNKGKADKVLQNLFHSETDKIKSTEFCSVGLHPWHVKEEMLQYDLEKVNLASQNVKVIAIGEAGLDKTIDTNLDTQRKAFTEQIDLAKERNKPMIIHCVRAYDELQALRKKAPYNKPWIIHWYNASSQTGLDLINKGCYLSFGISLFNESSKALKTFLNIPLTHVFFETDDADINIQQVYKKAASLRGISLPKLQKQINLNFYNCFGIEL